MATKKISQYSLTDHIMFFAARVNSPGTVAFYFEPDTPQDTYTHAKKFTIAPSETLSNPEATDTQENARKESSEEKNNNKPKKQMDPSENKLKAKLKELFENINFGGITDYDDGVSEGLMRKSDGKKQYFIVKDTIKARFPDKNEYNEAIKLGKRLKCIIAGPIDIGMFGIESKMYEVDLRAVEKSLK